MNRSLVPVTLSPHLVPYLYKEMDGTEAHYRGKSVKAVHVRMSSAIGRIIRMFCVKIDAPVGPEGYNIFLSVPSVLGKRYNAGSIYASECGRNAALHLPDEFVDDINLLFEEILNFAMCNYVDGTLLRARIKMEELFPENEKGLITQALLEFGERYDLFENGILLDSMRKIYLRDRNRDEKLKRLSTGLKRSKKVLSYSIPQLEIKFAE